METTKDLSINATARWRQLTVAYFLYFITLGLYAPYFPVYLRGRGLDAVAIGWVLALNPLMKVVFPPLLGFLADRTRGPRFWGMVTAWGGGVGLCLVGLSGNSRTLVLGSLCYFIFTAPIMPLLDAAAVRRDAGGADTNNRYGHVRLWGSIGYMVTSFGLGLLYPQMPGHVIAVSFIATHILFAIYMSAAPVGEAPPARGPDWHLVPSLLRNSKIWLLLSTLFLNRVASAPFYGFYTIFVQESGLGGEVVAWTWGLAVTTEIIAMLVIDRFIDRMGTTRVLAFGVCLEAARWFVYAAAAGSETALLLLAPWHGIAFTALYVAGVRELAELIPDRLRSLGQGLGAAANGLGQVAGLVIAGYAHQMIGNRGMFLIGGCVGLLACANALLLSYLVHRRHKAGRGSRPTSEGYGVIGD